MTAIDGPPSKLTFNLKKNKRNLKTWIIKMDLNEARRNLESVLPEDLRKQYFAYLRQWFLFNATLTKEQFDQNVRRLFYNEEQIAYHNIFLLAILSKATSNSKPRNLRSSTEKSSVETDKQKNINPVPDKAAFEPTDFVDYVQPISPRRVLQQNYEYRSAAAELFSADNDFIACRIAVTAWENDMDGANRGVTELVVHACQVFLKNIITAMITKLKGYKLRDKKFQYGFNMPLPDPYMRNSNNVIDESMETNIELDEDMLKPKCKMSLERVEQEVAYAYAATKKAKSIVTLTRKLLYNTLKENPDLLGQHSIQSVGLLKLGLHCADNEEYTISEDEDSDT